MIFALVGNQNCGKTTLFNALTGSNQHVGNFPGVTVDQKTGEIRGEKGCSVVDLPGIYSLRPYTQEEIVSRDYILQQKPDGIINIVDATNIERNLYLTLQLLELRVPMVLALNMMDEVRANGGTVDVQRMSRELGIPVVPISAAKGEGVSELVDQALAAARERLRHRLGRDPRLSELAEETGLTPEEIASVELATGAPESLQQETAEGLTLESTLGTDSPEERMVEHIALREAIDQLPEREKMTILLRFFKGLTQEQTARILGVSQVQISRLERRGLADLRRLLDG